MDIVQYPDERLKAVAEKVVDFTNIPELALTLRQAQKEHNGVGIAANQIGDPRAVCIVRDITMVNPIIIGRSEILVRAEEGCLSVGASGERHERLAYDKVKVAYQNVIGKRTVREFTGWDARIVQHELRHLNGLTIVDA